MKSFLKFVGSAFADARSNKRFFSAMIVLFAAALLPDIAMASNSYADDGSAALEGIFNAIAGWTQGYLGRLVTLLFIAIGIVSGMVRGSLMGFAIGIGAGIGLYNAPRVVESMFGALLM